MAKTLNDWDSVVAFALTLPDTELTTSYRKPAVKVASNDRGFVFVGHEAATSFVLALDLDMIEMLKETAPETFWQTPHYMGYEAVLVRFDSPDPERVETTIARSRDWTAARPPVKPRKKKA